MSAYPRDPPARDRRPRKDGEARRRTILDAAARLATVEGLDGLSIGRLAEEISMSKSGVYAHFKSKEALQLAAVDTAREILFQEVIQPAMARPAGRARLEALCDAFLSYVERRVFPGGCFFASAAAEMGPRPGPVRERLVAVQLEWSALLVAFAKAAADAGDLEPATDLQQLAFELNAMLVAANGLFLLHGDPRSIDRARTAIAARLDAAAA